MACFIAPAAEAVIVTAAEKISAKKENGSAKELESGADTPISFRSKVKWLENMLWGGSALLAFEHVWHGEVVPWFPFLTAAENPADFSAMLGEIATTGVTMAAAVTAVWGLMLIGADMIERRTLALRGLAK